jgi:16S rRNA (uracil1498-N3)-methyltransferase
VRRFTIAPERIAGRQVTFDRQETHHLARVLRQRPGDVVIAVDGSGRDYAVRLESLGEHATGTVLDTGATVSESPCHLTLVQALPKGDRLDAIVRASTELGVARIVPVSTERTVVRLERGREASRLRRWRRIAAEAAKQSGRSVVPEVENPQPLAEWLEREGAGEAPALRLCLRASGAPALAAVLEALDRRPSAALIVIGPEGGLSPAELERLRHGHWAMARLGPRILRTETAGPAALAILQFQLGDLGTT